MKIFTVELTEAERRLIAVLVNGYAAKINPAEASDGRGYPGEFKRCMQIWKKLGGLTGKE